MISRTTALTVLDCTFRDGGYYNNWYFEPKTVQRYIGAVVAAGVDAVEIGFRMPPQPAFCGPFAYCTDEFLRTLNIPSSIVLGVMINAKDFISPTQISAEMIKSVFASRGDSPVGLVRIAAHFRELNACESVVKALSGLGYRVGFNLMQATGKSPKELADAAKQIAGWGCVEVLYFADSFGNMKPAQIREMVSALRGEWHGALGAHTHDNMGLALSNSLEAASNGVSWIDSTVLGMGRGAGNTQTEHLLVELAGAGLPKYNAQPLFALVLEDFAELKRKYEWGPNLLYYLSAAYNIHPTYVQEILSSNNRDSQHVLDSLEYLRSSGVASSYDAKRLAKSQSGSVGGSAGSWSATALNATDDVLILGPGPSGKHHQGPLNRLVELTKMTVLATNTVNLLSPDLVTAHVACHHTKLMLDYDKYKSLKRPVILPLASLPAHAQTAIQDVQVWDYGLVVNDEAEDVDALDSHCVLPINLVAGYAMSVAVASGAKRVLFAGFDGFSTIDPQHIQMQNLFDLFKARYPGVRFLSLTPTTYRIDEGSVYAPGIAP